MIQIKRLKLALLITLILLLGSCTENHEDLFENQILRWHMSGAVSTTVNLDGDQTENEIVTLQMRYDGEHHARDLTGTFVLGFDTDAVPGEQFKILNGNGQANEIHEVTIPANSNISEEIEIEIISPAIERNEQLTISLILTNNGDIPPHENNSELLIHIDKEGWEVISGEMAEMDLTLTNPSNNSTGYRFLDIATGAIYTFRGADDDLNIQAEIDFGLFNSGSAGLVMVVPANDSRLGGWSNSGHAIRDEWLVKNDGIFIKLPALPEYQNLFEDVFSAGDIRDAFYYAEENISSIPGYDEDTHGPGGHIEQISEGEVILFKSLDRDIYLLALVENAIPGGDGTMDLSIKRVTD